MSTLLYAKADASLFKNMLRIIKELTTDVELCFGPHGLSVTALDQEKVALLELSISGFEDYQCEEPITIGIYVHYFYKLLSAVGPDHEILFMVRSSAPRMLDVSLLHNSAIIEISLESITLDTQKIESPVYECVNSGRMKTAELQKLVRELAHVSNRTTMLVPPSDVLTFTSVGDMGSVVLSVDPVIANLDWTTREKERTYEAEFFIKYMDKFLKGKLDEYVYIQFGDGQPLRLLYEIANMGYMCLTIAKIEPEPLD